jgi:TRAP-type C4-dicarboxylate transport system substrate-binding protein
MRCAAGAAVSIGCAISDNENTAVNPIVLEFGGYQKPASIHNRAALLFGEALGKELGDRISFHLTGNILDLGRKSGDLSGMVERGELSFSYISTVRFTKAVPEFRILELPFLIRDRASAYRALDGQFGERLRRRMEATTPFRVLGFWDNGFRHISNRVRPIRRPEDCRGIRIRTQMSELHGEVFRALGFQPIATDIKQFVEEIGADTFDSQDNPLTNIFNFGVHAHHRYITLTGHFFGATVMLCNEQQFQRWPPAVRAAVETAAAQATAFQRRLAAAEDSLILGQLDPRDNEVISLSDSEHAAFVNAVQPILAKYRAELAPELFAYFE